MFKPVYKITDKIASQISQIAEIKSLVERTRLLPKRETFLRRAAVIKMAHSSTSIEGNQLQEYQVKNLLEGKQVKAEKDQIAEVKNYLVALNQIDGLAQDEKMFTVSDILAVHKSVVARLVEEQKAEKFRLVPVYVVNVLANGNEKLVYTPPPFKQVPDLMGELLEWLKNNEAIHPIIRAGLFHYQFESIHPFTDGNGRTGRLMTLLSLYQSGWDFKKVLVLEDYYNRNRKNYYSALQTGKTIVARTNIDVTTWLEYFVEGFLDEVLKIKNQILNVAITGTGAENPETLDLDELKIVDFVLTLGKITSSDVEDILDIPKRTAQFKLNKLEDKKILKKVEFGPGTHYVINMA